MSIPNSVSAPSAAALDLAAVNGMLEAVTNDIKSEFVEYTQLRTNLDLLPKNLVKVSKFWDDFNEQHSDRYREEMKIAQKIFACSDAISKLAVIEQAEPAATLHKIVTTFQRFKEEQAATLSQFKAAQAALEAPSGMLGKFPIWITISKEKAPQRQIPTLIYSDIQTEMQGDRLIFTIPMKKGPPTPPPPKPHLVTRIAKGIYNNIGKIAFVASAAIIASQTDMGAKLMADAAAAATEYAVHSYEPIRQNAAEIVSHVVTVAKNNLPAVGSAFSAIWSLPSIYRNWAAGNKKTAVAMAALGAASAVAPHALQPGAGEKALAQVNAMIDSPLAQQAKATATQYLPGIASGLSSLVSLPAAVKAWKAGYKKTAVALPLVAGATAGAATHAHQAGYTVNGVVEKAYAFMQTPFVQNAIAKAKENAHHIGTAIVALPAAFKAWRAGYKKTAVGIVVGGAAASIGSQYLPAGTAQKAYQMGSDLVGKAVNATRGIKSEL